MTGVDRPDLIVIGGGPAGAATAIRAARGGARVVLFEKGKPGRDKVCGDGLTPRAVAALEALDVSLDEVVARSGRFVARHEGVAEVRILAQLHARIGRKGAHRG